MATLNIRSLDITNQTDILQLETAMYTAFSHYSSDLYKGQWEFDHDTKRAKTIIPYASQQVFVAEVDGTIIGAIMINLDMQAQTQYEKIGFTANKEQGITAEGTVLFTNKAMVGRKVVLICLVEKAAEFIRDLGIKVIYMTCNKKHLFGYQQLGFHLIDKTMFNGQQKFFLQQNLP